MAGKMLGKSVIRLFAKYGKIIRCPSVFPPKTGKLNLVLLWCVIVNFV